MNITTSQHDLSRELSLLANAADKKSSLPILGCVLIETNGTSAMLTATDTEIAIHSKVDCKIAESGAAAIPVNRILPFVRSLPSGEVSVKLTANHYASVSSGKTRARIPGESHAGYPELPEPPSEPTVVLPLSSLARMAQSTMFAAAENLTSVISNIKMEITESSCRMVAVDGTRMGFIELPGGGSPMSILLPKRILAEVVRLNDISPVGSPAEIFIDPNHIWIRAGHRTVQTRLPSGNYPMYERMIPSSATGSFVVNKDDFRSVLQRISPFSDRDSRKVRLVVSDGSVSIFAQETLAGECEDVLSAKTDGEIEIAFNAQLILDFLASLNTAAVRVSFESAVKPAKMEPVGLPDGETVFCLIAPMRVN